MRAGFVVVVFVILEFAFRNWNCLQSGFIFNRSRRIPKKVLELTRYLTDLLEDSAIFHGRRFVKLQPVFVVVVAVFVVVSTKDAMMHLNLTPTKQNTTNS